MMRRLVLLSVIALVWGWSAAAEEWNVGAWHYIQANSPLHSQDRDHLHGAGLIQKDGSFALLVLGEAEQGGLMSVNLPGDAVATTLTSVLTMSRGVILTRSVSGAQVHGSLSEDGTSVTYTFRLAPDDLERFMAAQSWTLRHGTAQKTFTLSGTRKAISAALQARDTADTLVAVQE